MPRKDGNSGELKERALAAASQKTLRQAQDDKHGVNKLEKISFAEHFVVLHYGRNDEK